VSGAAVDLAALRDALRALLPDHALESAEPLGRGHIHDTISARCRSPHGEVERYVAQRVNDAVFRDPQALARNLVRVSDHLGRALRTVGDARFTRDSPHYLDTSKDIQLLQAETPRVRADKGAHIHGFGNTHYWLDPENGRPITAAILAALLRLAPGDRPYFETNRRRFLDQLDGRLKGWLQTMAPYKGIRVVAVHETWPYFAQRFGLMIVAVVEPNPGVPPSPSYLDSLIQKMRDSGIKLLIADPYSNASAVRQVATQSGATAVTLIPSVGGDPAASDYLSLFDFNIKRLSKAAGTQ